MIVRFVKYAVIGLAGFALAIVAKRAFGRLKMPVCDDSIRAIHHGGTREMSPGRIRLIVIHSTEGDTARGAALWFANEASGGSAHYVVDDSECYRTLPDNVVPWGAKGDRANEDGLHIELAGHASWTREEWMHHAQTLLKAAAIVQHWVRTYGVPARFLTAADLKRLGDSARGITTHNEITKAFDIAGGHVDPGAGFPIDTFMGLV